MIGANSVVIHSVEPNTTVAGTPARKIENCEGNSSMTPGKVLITGGLGFIGRHVAELLVEQGRQVLLFDNLSPQTHGAVPRIAADGLVGHPWVEIYRGDVRQPADWEKVLPEVRYVIHMAAETGTAQSMYEISRYTETNVGGTAALLELPGQPQAQHSQDHSRVLSLGVWRRRLSLRPMRTCLSSDALRRQAQLRAVGPAVSRLRQSSIEAAATPEDAKLAPASIYAATKLAQEDLVRIATRALGIPAVILRMQNVYGEGQSLKNPYTGILSIFSNQLRLGKTLNLYEDGQESRDFRARV